MQGAMGTLFAALCCTAPLNRCVAQTSDVSTARSAATALMEQGIEEAAQGRLAEADVTLERAEKLAPDDARVLASLGKVKARVGEVEPAISLFRHVATLQPRSAEAHLDLAVALADARHLDEALAQILRAQELSPGLAAAHLNHARILADLHRTADAEPEFAKAANLAPSNPDCFFYWALLEREKGNYVKESSLLKALVMLQPRNDTAWVLLGNSLAYQSKQPEAIASWREALTINPHSSQAVYKLSRALRASDPAEAKRLEEDFAALRQSSETLEGIKALGNQAYTAMQAKDWTTAIATFKQAIDRCGDCAVSGTLHKDLGLAYGNSGLLQEGKAELEIALQLNPQDPDIARALAVLSQKTPAP